MAESRVIITADAEQARREIERFRDSASGSMGQVGALSGKLGDTLKSLGFAALAAGAIKLSDAYDQMTARLKMATATTTQLMVAQRELMAISVRQRSGLDATVDLYAKTSAATADMGVSQKSLLKFTEGVSAALRINGTTAEAAAGALNQLGQAMGGSTIQAEEYNSILDGARPLLQAVANNIGAAGGSVAKLTALVKAGKVGTAEFFEAAVKGSDELIAAGDKIPLTFSQALGVAKDRLMMFVGGVNQSTGAVSGMSQGVVAASEAIVFLSAHLDVVVGVVGTLVAARLGSWALTAATNLYGIVVASRAAAAATLVTAQAEVTATATASSLAAAKVIQARATLAGMAADADKTIAILILNAAEQKAAAAASAHTLAQMAQTAALRATSVAAGVARSALALVGGPIGAIVTVLGLAATAWYAFGKSASDSSQEAAGAAELTSDEIVANLEKQTAKLRERIALAKLGQVEIAKMESPEAQGIAKMGARIANMRANYSSLTGVQQIALIELTEQFNKASAAMTRTVSATTDMAGVKTLQTTGEWMKKYATNAEKLKEKLDEVRKSYADGVIPAELEKRIRESFADKDAAGALKKEADAYTNLSVAIGTKIKETTLEMSGLSNLNEAQKLQIALDEQIAAGKLTLAPKHKAAYEQQIKDLAVNLEVIESRKRAQAGAEAMGKVEDAYQEQVKRRLATTVDEAEKNEELVRTFGMTKAAISQLELSRLEEQLAQRASTGLTMDEIDALEKLIAAKKRSAVSTITLEGLEADKAATAAKLAESKKMWESIDQTAQDTLVSIGNSSISAIDRVWGSLKKRLVCVALPGYAQEVDYQHRRVGFGRRRCWPGISR
ncbi:tape measure protein [Janthinobacterium sp. 75]|uniref:tape measure protein n=1 Tax=Janthinobacterium sp. 75 TaxID=2135628 RepID=UPI001062D2B1|nr:tape measure protein [Janthinobacterium sp. 75]TDY35087.1 tape measure domain-containing protein [Janthinobacterium sp. 75]